MALYVQKYGGTSVGTTERISAVADKIKGFFPLESMSRLIDEPFTRLGAVQAVANQVGETLKLDYEVRFTEILITLVWTTLFIYWSYALLKKRDL